MNDAPLHLYQSDDGGWRLRLTPPAPVPPAAPTMPQAEDWPTWDHFTGNPGVGLTARRYARALRAAENGYPAQLVDIWEDVIESDGHLRGLVDGRISDVAGKPWVLTPSADEPASVRAAEVLTKALRRQGVGFVDFLEHQLTATFYGWSLSNIHWSEQRIEGEPWMVPSFFASVPHRRTRFDDTDTPRLIQPLNIHPGEELSPGQWVYSRRRARLTVRAGLMRTAGWWSLFKRLSVRDWIIFAEKFGIPITLGFYKPGQGSDETRKALEKAITDIGEDGQAVLADTARIVVEQTSQRGGDAKGLHEKIVDLCNAEMSKLINGSTLTSDSGGPGSFALGRVHETAKFQFVATDAWRLGNTFQDHVGRPFLAFNGIDATPPFLTVQVSPDVDMLTFLQGADIMVNKLGVPLDRGQVYERTGYRPPADESGPEAVRGVAPSGGQEPEGGNPPMD